MTIVESIRAEYVRYKTLAEGAISQLSDEALANQSTATSNSIGTLCWHVSGNLESRFTDFLTTDGEKPWRHREEEFQARAVTRAELLDKWSRGWNVLLATLDSLSDADLQRTITIRKQALPVHEALERSLAHAAYHVGQIVFIAKSLQNTGWRYLSIPPGQSDAYNANPAGEHVAGHVEHVQRVQTTEANTEPRAIAADVRAVYARLLDAWNRRDAGSMAAGFADDGSMVGFDGTQISSRTEIERHLRPIFADHPTPAYVGKVREVKSISPDTAVISAVAGMIPASTDNINPALNTVHTLVAVRGRDDWEIALFQSTPAAWHGRPADVAALTEELRSIVARGRTCE